MYDSPPIATGRPVDMSAQQTYTIQIPNNVSPGQQFRIVLDNQLMVVTCPPDASPGSVIQVAVAQPAAGMPVSAPPNMVLMGGPPPGYVEVDEISPAGWFCLIAGCFFCPGFNLLGLCMRERRLIPVHDHGYWVA
ncbi:hypothetical protein AB1Y20_006154 [Prymnesium parvum]|uniref:Uncharacterized protein n=1 Tax=Prymnesium parvum TaxID=97485 RepID=A0AB34J2F5_PRYPA|mmetsp:Transcript_11965/g.25220  ORF Transcript_11965/g.25220 Transcript_11965/m.25220 type:complete len:135 (-) Transcript_11965:435-839(-)